MLRRWTSFRQAARDVHDRAGVPLSEAGTWLERAQAQPDRGLSRTAGSLRVTVTASRVKDGSWEFEVSIRRR